MAKKIIFVKGPVCPEQQTSQSAGFDIRAALRRRMTAYTNANVKTILELQRDTPVKGEAGKEYILIPPRWRVLIPTGIETIIPDGHWVDISIRSSVALKGGLQLHNGRAVIDADYREEWGVILFNPIDVPVRVDNGERIAQATLTKSVKTKYESFFNAPRRKGGFGSTGRF